MNEELRDRSGRLIGKIVLTGSKYEGRDASGRLKGTYDPKNNQTRDARGNLVGKGNMLSMLIADPTR